MDVAINQIKLKEYVQKFKKENNEVLAVAICYDSKLKEHSCKIERVWVNLINMKNELSIMDS